MVHFQYTDIFVTTAYLMGTNMVVVTRVDCILRLFMFNPLPPMPILGSSNSTAKKAIMSKIWTNGDTIDWVENIVGKEEIARNKQFLFRRFVRQTNKNMDLFGKCLTLSQTSPGSFVSAVQVFWKHSFSHRVFYLFQELSAISIKFKIVVCKLFQFGMVKNLSYGKGLRNVKNSGFWDKGLTHYQKTKSWTGSLWNSLQTTILNLMKIEESSLTGRKHCG